MFIVKVFCPPYRDVSLVKILQKELFRKVVSPSFTLTFGLLSSCYVRKLNDLLTWPLVCVRVRSQAVLIYLLEDVVLFVFFLDIGITCIFELECLEC